jgi:endoglucanase
VAEGGRTQVDVVAVASVQEEIGHHGARIAAYGLDPAVALAIDVTWTTDVPGGDPRVAGKIEIGGGPAIAVGATLDRGVSDLLAETAEAEGIAYATEVYTRATWTDADDIRGARAGVPTGLVSIPTRYMHTPNELCALADVEEVVRLVTAFAERLPR